MPRIQHHDYQGYDIVAMATPAGSGKYHSIFSVDTTKQIYDSNSLRLAHQEKITDSPTYATEEEAIDAARGRAKAWIDMRMK